MIRLVVVAIGVFLVWLLFVSSAVKKHKILLGFSAVLSLGLTVWLENYLKTPREGVVEVQEISLCGISATYSYRSNYNISYCLKNDSKEATIKRLELRFLALDCLQQPCVEQDAVIKQREVSIAAGESRELTDNLAFPAVKDRAIALEWRLEVISVRAL